MPRRTKLVSRRMLDAVGDAALFTPGLVLVALAVAVVFMPSLVLGLVALFFLLMGVLCTFIAYKFMKVKRKVEHLVQQFDGKVLIKTGNIAEGLFEESADSAQKKILYH
jgi:membrane protein implicated in regulation of membrane protease activity